MQPKVSVVVCTYNQEKTIARTLDSILAQNGNYPYEIILGEDGSKDGTRTVCEEYAKRFPDIIKLLPAAPNKGMMRNWRDCLAECKGEYIMACAGDDWWHNPDKIKIQVEFMDHNPDYVMCYTGAIRNNLKMNTITKMPAKVTSMDAFEELLTVDYISAPTACYRSTMLQIISIDSYIINGYVMEDYPAWLEMARYGKLKAINEYTVTYTQSSNSISTFDTLEKQIEFESIAQKVRRDIVKKYNLEDKYPGSFLNNIYYRNLYSHGIKFNDRNFSLDSIRQVTPKSGRDILKLLMASNQITFSIIRKRNHGFATV